MEKITLKTSVWAILNSVRSDDPTREALAGIAITDKYIEATNGRALVRYKKQDGEVYPKNGVYYVMAANKLGKYAGTEVIIEANDIAWPNTAAVADGYSKTVYYGGISTNFTGDPAALVIKTWHYTGRAINLEYVDGLFKAAKIERGLTYTVKDKPTANKDNPIMFVVGDDVELLVMPFRVELPAVEVSEPEPVAA